MRHVLDSSGPVIGNPRERHCCPSTGEVPVTGRGLARRERRRHSLKGTHAGQTISSVSTTVGDGIDGLLSLKASRAECSYSLKVNYRKVDLGSYKYELCCLGKKRVCLLFSCQKW